MRKEWKGALIGGVIGALVFLVVIIPLLIVRMKNPSSYDLIHFVSVYFVGLVLIVLISIVIGYFFSKKTHILIKGPLIGGVFGLILPIFALNFNLFFLTEPIKFVLKTFNTEWEFESLIHMEIFSILIYSLVGLIIALIILVLKNKGIKKHFLLVFFALIFYINLVSAQQIDYLNITINHPNSVRVGTETLAGITIRNLNENKPIFLDEISFLDKNNNNLLSKKSFQEIPSVKSEIERYLCLTSEDNCDESDSTIIDELDNLLLIISEKTFYETYYLDLKDFKNNLTPNDEVIINIRFKFIMGEETQEVIKKIVVLYSEPLPNSKDSSQRLVNMEFVPNKERAIFINETILEDSKGLGIMSALPSKPFGWYAGDQHVHESTYGSTGLETINPMNDMIYAAKNNADLDWILFTDHSYSMDDTEWEDGYDDCTSQSTTTFKCLFGQEMSIGNRCGGAHYLAYPSNTDSLGYIDGDCGLFHCFCRASQTVMDEINDNGGMGFIAHPFSDSWGWEDWTLTGYTGLEIFNAKDGVWKSDDTETLDKWNDLLQAEINPSNGFIVGVGNSDAHTTSYVGGTFTYCYMSSLSSSNIRSALKEGHCVISNGPLIYFTIKNTKIGEKADVCSGGNTFYLEAYTNSEFGDLNKAEVYVDGNYYGYLSLSGDSYSSEVSGLNIDSSNKYIYLKLKTDDSKYLAYTNPIWLDVYTPDYDSDGTCDYYDSDDDNDGVSDSFDSCNFNYGTFCHGCPMPPCGDDYYPSCPETGEPVCLLDCEPDWRCSNWGPEPCPQNEIQIRTCVDSNGCGTDGDKPPEIQDCNYTSLCTPNSPLNGIYPERRILLDIEATEELDEIEYKDNFDSNPRWKRLCSRCDEYERERSFRDGVHNLLIRCTPFAGEPEEHEVSFVSDSKDPRISRTEPRRNSFTNGNNFYVKFKEENPTELSITYNPTMVIDLENCSESRGYTECYTDLDLTPYDNQEISYFFTIEDIAGHKDESSPTKVKVDTTPPLLNNPLSFWEQGTGRNSRYIYFEFDVTELNFKEINYIDWEDSRPREKRLCSRLRNGICEVRKSFRSGSHDLTITILDEAGNSWVEEGIGFSV